MSHYIVPFKTYRNVLFALLFLTFLTVALAPPVSGIDLGPLNALIAVAIALTKATLVGMYFMQLKYDDKIYSIMLISAVGFVLLLFVFAILDIYTRVFQSSPL